MATHLLSRLALFALLALFAVPASAQDGLVLSGVIDGPLTGGTPKAVELYVGEDIADLSLYAVGSANNGGGTDGPEFVLSGTASAGDYLYVASEAEQFAAFFGFAPEFVSGAAAINGDDAVELFYDGDGFGEGEPEEVVDTFGEIDQSGTDQDWEYADGWAYREDGTGPDGTTFVLTHWTFSGPDALDGATTNGDAATPFPLGTYAPGSNSATPVVTLAPAAATISEGASLALAITLDFPNDNPDGNPVTVTVTFDDDASTASESDIALDPVQVTFDGTADEETMTVTVTATPDEAVEDTEVAVLDLFVAGGIADLGDPTTLTLTILDGGAPEPARVQLIHNAPDPLADLVDVSIVDVGEGGDGAVFDDVPFRSATPFFDLAPGTYQVTVTDEKDLAVVIINQEVLIVSGETYQLVATGVADPALFAPNPDGIDTAAQLLVNNMALESGTSGAIFADISAVHGTPDAPAVDVVEASSGIALVEDIAYTDITGYAAVPVGGYVLNVTPADDNANVIASFAADLSGFGGQAVTVLASGFLDPSANQDGPALGILLVEADGTTTLLEPLMTDAEDGLAAPAAFRLAGIYPNPVTATATVRYDLPTDAAVRAEVFDLLGRRVLEVDAGAVSAGSGHQISLDARALPAGTYVYRITAETASETARRSGRMTVVR